MREKKITIYDIAREAGVSVATVTRVMQGSDKVREETRKNVQSVIDRYGFAPNRVAQGLSRGTTHTIGVILRDIANPYFSRLVSAADDEARKNGYSLMMWQIPLGEKIRREQIDAYLRQGLDATYFVGVADDTSNEMVAQMLDRVSREMPVVAMCPPIAGVKCISMYNDLDGGMRQAVRHLHLLGHERIAMIGGNKKIEDCGQRGLAFLDEIRNLGLEETDQSWRIGGGDAETGCREAAAMLKATEGKKRPTGLIAFNDLVAMGAIRQLKMMNVRVPEDVALIGCDNQMFSEYLDPPLTTIDLQAEEHARNVIRHLINARTEDAGEVIVRKTNLVVRESCGSRLGWRDLR